jgi:hypothetical protein
LSFDLNSEPIEQVGSRVLLRKRKLEKQKYEHAESQKVEEQIKLTRPRRRGGWLGVTVALIGVGWH